MGKPLDSKPIQIYANNELYDQLKTLVDSNEYRSFNAAVIALVGIGLKYREQSNSAASIGNVDLISQLQAQILELSNSTVKRSELIELEDRIVEKFSA